MSTQEALHRYIESAERLPTLPEVALRVIEEAQRPESSARRIAEVVSADPALAARLLRTVNSAAFGPAVKVGTVERAVALLGSRAVVNLAVCFAVVRDFSAAPELGAFHAAVWRQALTAAVASRALAETLEPANADEIFMGALLSDLGRLVLATTEGVDYRGQVLDAACSVAEVLHLERGSFGFDHAALGAAILQLWRLPERVCSMVAWHHTPEGAPGHCDSILRSVRIGYLGHCIAEAMWETREAASFYRAQAEAECFFGIDAADFARLVDLVGERAREAAALFDIEAPQATSYTQLIEAANHRLRDIGVSLEQMVGELSRSRAETERVWRMLRNANEQLKAASVRDSLTGLYNGAFFDDLVRRELARTRAYGRPFSVLLLTVDDMARIVERAGSVEADELLRRVATCLHRSVREADLVARLGGDTFGVLMPETAAEGAMLAGERLVDLVGHDETVQGRLTTPVSVSVGVSPVVLPGRVLDRAELLLACRAALARARQAGGSRVAAALLADLAPAGHPHGATIASA